MFFGLCNHIFLYWLEININGFNRILQCIKGRTSNDNFMLNLFFCWVERCRTIHKSRTFLNKVSIVRRYKCNFCGYCLPKILIKRAKREILLFSLRITSCGGIYIQQSHILSLCIVTSKIVMKIFNNSNAVLKFKYHV